MENWQRVIVIFWGICSFVIFLKGFGESNKKKNASGSTPLLFPWRVFVWGDAVVFGAFWTLASITVLFLNDWVLFLLVISVFWVVRSLGETIYWFNQQFSKVHKNPPEENWMYKYFHNDSLLFIHQIGWQCVIVLSIIMSIYLAKIWF